MNYPLDSCGAEINIQVIRQRLHENAQPSAVQSTGRKFRAAAVLIPLICVHDHWHLLYTRRTNSVQNHKGQVSFPGGAVDDQDTSREDTALREVYEEIGVSADQIEVLGRMAEMPTVTGFVITPIVARMNWPQDLVLSPGEVTRAFKVPLAWLANPTNHEEIELVLPDGRRQTVIYYEFYDGEKIWGATARITLNFLHMVGLF